MNVDQHHGRRPINKVLSPAAVKRPPGVILGVGSSAPYHNPSSASRSNAIKMSPTNQIFYFIAAVLASSFLIFNLVITTHAKYGVEATFATTSNLSSDRVHIIRQPAILPGSSYKQTKQNYKEKFDKLVIQVKENTPIGSRLIEVQPRDADVTGHANSPISSQQNQQTIYAIVGGLDAQSFTLRKTEHDKVELINEVNFDYESDKKTYTVQIRALSVYFRYELDVDILVEDENDNKPQLEDFAIVFNNYKNHFPTGPIGRVPATDLDVTDKLRYRVLTGNNAQLIIVNETTGDIQLSPWLDSNVPLRAVMDVAVSDGNPENDAIAKLVLTVNLVTELMLHNSVMVRLDAITREEFLSKKYDIFLNQMARILATNNQYSTSNIVVFDVEEGSTGGQTQEKAQEVNSTIELPAARPTFRASHQHAVVTNISQYYVNVSFSARTDGNDIESYLSRQYIEERIFLNRMMLSQNMDVQVALFQDDVCVQEPCLNYQECQVTHKFDRAPKTIYSTRNMIFRQIKTTQSFSCLCPPTFTGMKTKNECNLQINQCFTNPCLNGGLCHRHESGYTCECPGEFFGNRCEHSFSNSTCQSLAATRLYSSAAQLGSSMSENMISSSTDFSFDLIGGSVRQSTLAATTTCSSKSRCVNLNRSLQHYYSKASPATSISAASAGSSGGFVCQGCPHPNQWVTDLCQLRARSFDKHSFIVLPSLRRRHRFHLALKFNTVQSDGLLIYNGRYNDKQDFIALEIVDSRLRFSYSLGQAGQITSVSLSSIAVSDGQWHKVAVEYRDRNVTITLDDCDPVLDEALARLEPNNPNRCSNSTAPHPDQLNSGLRMLDLTSPMQIGSIQSNGNTNLAIDLDGESSPIRHMASLANSFSGCLSDFYVDHQLVDLSAPLQEVGTQPGCPERHNLCQVQSCNGFPCQESQGAAKCQCGDDRIGQSCELFLSQEKVRRFTGNSYLAFNPIEAQIPTTWRMSLHFRTLNPSGVLFKIALDPEASILLEVANSGLKLSYRSRNLHFNKIPVDDDEWHFVELTWSTFGLDPTSTLTTLQVDHNPNLSVQSSELGPITGSTMRHVVVGSSSTRNNLSPYTSGPAPSVSAGSISQDASLSSSVAPESSAGFGITTPPTPTTLPLAAAGGPLESNDFSATFNSSSLTFVGCIFGFNMSDNAEWWQSPYDERNMERGCPTTDPCDTKQCPANSRCVRKGLNQRKCLCNPGFVGESCTPVCDLQPCKGDNSKCISANSLHTNATSDSNTVTGNHHQDNAHYTCECEANRSGRNCEHQLSQRCPSNWWNRPVSAGANYSSCGPCNCDESKGLDGDCDKLTGQCFCKPNHYRPPGSFHCLACECYSIGSLSTACNQTTGQCKCRPGVVGRRCDSCASQYAEVTLRGCEVTYDLACPKTYSDGIWWEKTQLDRVAEQQCPVSTSTGTATRLCHKTDGWQKANLFDCISNTFIDLYKQYEFLDENKFKLTTNLAMKIASNLRMALNETTSSQSMQLYGSDMYISFRLIHHLIQHETLRAGLNLTHRQDRHYIRNIVESISYILDPVYADNWPEIAARSPNGGAEYLLKLLDNFGKTLSATQSDTYTLPFEIVTKHLTFGMDTLSIDQLYDMSRWTLGASASFNPTPGVGSHFPSSPPYATDPFDSPFGPISSSTPTNKHAPFASETPPAGHFNPDGTSVYLDFSTMRDSSASVVLPKYDNYPSLALDLNDSIQMQHTQSRVFIPLKTLRMRQPKEIIGSLNAGSPWGMGAAARSRAKRDELVIPDYAAIRNQRQPIVVYSIYKTLGPLLPGYYDNSVQNRLGQLAMANSPVIWLTVRPQNSTDFLAKNIQPKITYMLKMVEPIGKTRPQCAIWDFVAPSSQAQSSSAPQKNATSAGQQVGGPSPAYGIKQTGRFTTRGCEVKGVHPNHRLRSKIDYVNCSCDHLGAVIVLMDPSTGNYDFLAGDDSASFYEMFLVVSLWLSVAVLIATLFTLTCIRGHSIKSNSNSINKNLLLILVIIELLILYSTLSKGLLNQRQYQCQLVAIFLHYFSISLFFWLLVNAIHFYRMLTELRDINHGPMKFYHILGYVVPAFFVSIAVGLRIEQFGNYLFCWLSIHEPIIWSMFGPISLVAMLTIILFKLALCKSLPLNRMADNQEDSNGLDLIRTHMLINSIKTPLIGIHWLISVYAVNETLVEYSYVFPLVTLTKSIILFVLLCIVDKYIRYNLYVSWLRFRGQKVPFVDDSMVTYGNHGLGSGPLGANEGNQQYMISMLNPQDRAAYGGIGAQEPKMQTGQMLYPNQQQVLNPGFQSSCTDIFRTELLDNLSAASTTSRSSASGSSSGAHYREYRRGRTHRKTLADDESDNDADEQDDYGRAKRHRRRHATGKRSHRKHHHHGGRHHHHHHHSHHHKHRSHHHDDGDIE